MSKGKNDMLRANERTLKYNKHKRQTRGIILGKGKNDMLQTNERTLKYNKHKRTLAPDAGVGGRLMAPVSAGNHFFLK